MSAETHQKADQRHHATAEQKTGEQRMARSESGTAALVLALLTACLGQYCSRSLSTVSDSFEGDRGQALERLTIAVVEFGVFHAAQLGIELVSLPHQVFVLEPEVAFDLTLGGWPLAG